MRFNVGAKILSSLSLVTLFGLLCMLVIYAGLRAVTQAIERLAVVEHRLTAATYEMEVNVNGIGLAVLKYLDSAQPRYRAWVAEDLADFERFHSDYMTLASTEKERRLGERIGALYAEYAKLARDLMNRSDRQADTAAQLERQMEAVDRVVHARSRNLDESSAPPRREMERRLRLMGMEAEAAESGLWIARYGREPLPRYKASALKKLAEFDRELAGFRRLGLDPADLRLASRLDASGMKIRELIERAASEQDSIVGRRERLVELRVRMDTLLDDELQILAARSLTLPHAAAGATVEFTVNLLVVFVTAFLALALAAGLFLYRGVTRPLHRIMDGIAAVDRGDFNTRIERIGNDEFGDFAARFNAMVQELSENVVLRRRLPEAEAALQEATEQLHRAELTSALGRVVGSVAHEVRNPLFAISATLEAMTARHGGVEGLERYLEVLRKESSRLAKLMADLIEYGRPAREVLEPATLQSVIEQAVLETRAGAEAAGVVIRTECAGGLAPIVMDRFRLSLALHNLLENAWQHSPRGGEVSVHCTMADEDGKTWVQCEIADSGPGIAPQDLPRLFEPFYSRRPGGVGMGLSIVNRIVEAHGGEVLVRNRPNGGAAFTVRFPPAPRAGQAS